MGYAGYTAKSKPIPSVAQKQKRVFFAKSHVNWLPDDWSKVIWSDESHFELFNRKSRTFVRRKPNENEMPFCFVPRIQKGGGCISVSGCITSAGVDPLVFYNGRSYVQLIGDVLSAFINSQFGSNPGGFWYMQDNARTHVPVFAKKFFEKNKIPLLNWPPASRDLNPIENLWDLIDDQLRTMSPKNLMQLKHMIEQIWVNFQPSTCKGLVDSMPRRLQQCLIIHGGTMSKY